MTRIHRVVMLVASAQLWVGSVAAHETGFGRAVVSFTSREAYVATLTVDAASLLARLETLAGQPRSETLTASEYASRIAALQPELMKQVHVRFDTKGTEAILESVRAVGSAQPTGMPEAPEVLLTLRGNIPAGARFFTWRYDLTYASYALTLRAADGTTASTAWLEGGQESPAFSLSRIGDGPSTNPVAKAAGYIGLVPLFFLGALPFRQRRSQRP
jgi:hypothetical protein